MTKLKNTKKGMAKKALSVSLVAAMLATSNVPVWAAEDLFTDGSSAAVEAPVVEEPAAEVEAFSAEPAEIPVMQSSTTGTEYSVTLSSYMVDGSAIANNTTEWGGTLSTTASVSTNSAIAGATLKATWQVAGEAYGNVANITNGKIDVACELTPAMADKAVTLLIYAEKEGKVVWSYTSDPVNVKSRNISSMVKASASTPVYNGTERKAEISLSLINGYTNQNLINLKNYNVAYDGDLVNAGGEVVVTLTPNDNLEGYSGQITTTYTMAAKELSSNDDIAQNMSATLLNTNYMYTGNSNTKIPKADIKLVDKETGADLSNYLRVDKDGYVDVSFVSGTDAGTVASIAIGLIQGTPETGVKNYKIADSLTYPVIYSDNSMQIVARNLNTVNVTINPQKYTGEKVTISPSDVTMKDKTTGEIIVPGALNITVPDNAIDRGEGYVATITPGKTGSVTNKNISGSTTATFSIYSQNIANAYFENALPTKHYTGENITFTAEELGALKIKNDNGALETVPPEDYQITYSSNLNAGTAYIIVKGLGSYLGSQKVIPFTIEKASLSSVSAAEYVEIINTNEEKDYAEAMNIVVKAKNGAGKEFTLAEGTDYKVDYKLQNNVVGEEIEATITITNPNFKGASSVSNKVSSTIAAAVLKSEYIKLKESSFTYTGQPIEPEFDIVIGGKVINPAYYTTSYSKNINAGTATVSVTGDGKHYSGTASLNYTINPADANKLEGIIGTKEYTGYSLEIPADEIDLTLDGNKIDVASNFTLTYGENLNIGEGTVTLTPKNNNFTGTKTLTFQISGEMLTEGGTFKYLDENGFDVTSKKDTTFSYDGTAHTFAKTVFTYSGNEKLVEGEDYEIKYVDNVYGKSDGTLQKGAVLVIAKGKYGSNVTKNGLVNGIYTDAEGNKTANVIAVDYFTIAREQIAKSNVSVSNGVYAAGLSVKPVVSIVVKGTTLVEGKDYELDLSGNNDLVNSTSAKSLTVKIVPKNGYTTKENLTFSWGIDKFNLANADVDVIDNRIVVKCGAVDVDASEYTTTANNDGTTTITAVSTSKNYTGSKVVNTNGQTDAEKPATPMITDVKVNGNNATVILSGESDGATGYDYVISTDRDCITSKDYDKVNKNILGTQTTFTYTQQGTYFAYCHAWKRVNGVKVFSEWSNPYIFTVSAMTPEQPVITSVKKSGRNLTVTWTQSANAETGYDVVMGTAMRKVNGEMRPVEYGKAVKKVGPNTFSVTFKSIPKGTYYVGLHAHNRSSETGVKVFSPWSNAKKVTF